MHIPSMHKNTQYVASLLSEAYLLWEFPLCNAALLNSTVKTRLHIHPFSKQGTNTEQKRNSPFPLSTQYSSSSSSSTTPNHTASHHISPLHLVSFFLPCLLIKNAMHLLNNTNCHCFCCFFFFESFLVLVSTSIATTLLLVIIIHHITTL